MTGKILKLPLSSIFSDIHSGDFHSVGELESGVVPLVSCKTEKTPDHGVEGYYNISDSETYENCVTITSDGDQPSTISYHPYKFAAYDNVLVCIPKKDIKFTTILYAISCINQERWRFSYGRKCYKNKLDKLIVPFPVDSKGSIDQKKIAEILKPEKFLDVVKTGLKSLIQIHDK